MLAIKVILPLSETRRWHRVLVERLREAGHEVCVSVEETIGGHNRLLDGILQLENMFLRTSDKGLASRISLIESAATVRSSELVVDLSQSGRQREESAPILTARFQYQADLLAAAEVLCRGSVPVVDLYLDSKPVAHAEPMASSRAFISRGLNDVLARIISLIVRYVSAYDPTASRDPVFDLASPAEVIPRSSIALGLAYLSSTLPRLASRAIRRMRYYGGHWHVGYRYVDGPGVAETGSLAGMSWTVLKDPGDRFYADPFPFEWHGRHFIFVEELVHSQGRGVISVSECGPDGCFGVPRKVLEEPFHLSYPQVFARDGEVWMIPETSGGKKLSLYRAEQFPGNWVEQHLLVSDREIYDATLLDHNGFHWLFGSERDGFGNGADTMVVFFAECMEGPWRPHPMNPITIDKAAARPGGGFAKIGNRIILPLQDGTVCYGGGLGLAQLICLDRERVELSKPVPIDVNGHWPYPGIHTLNRHGRLETIDGLDLTVKRKIS